jgi:hypothetical protein
MFLLEFSQTFNPEIMKKIKIDLMEELKEWCRINILRNRSIITGDLYDSIDGEVKDSDIEVGTNIDYGLYVQWRKPWLVTKEQVLESLTKVFNKYS